MKFFIFFACLVGYSSSQYVWDYLKPALNAAEVQAILANARIGDGAFPTYTDIPMTNFDCGTKRQPGFYADPAAGCQVFHRCDINGNMTSYLCVNTTVFNQVTLVCDYFFNVDCNRAIEFENFANARLYQEGAPLFDTPTDPNYVPVYVGQGAAQIIKSQLAAPVRQATAPKQSKTRSLFLKLEE